MWRSKNDNKKKTRAMLPKMQYSDSNSKSLIANFSKKDNNDDNRESCEWVRYIDREEPS